MTLVPGLLTRMLRAIRTARHLRARQLLYWPLRRLQRRLPVSARAVSVGMDQQRLATMQARIAAWGPGDATSRISNADAVLRRSFTMLNRTVHLDHIDWTHRYESRLWTYHLQYFEFALDLAWAYRLTGDVRYRQVFGELAHSWISGAQPGRGDAWDPYVISLRVVNWIYTLALFGPEAPPAGAAAIWNSIGAQLSVLERRLEFHLLANHLLRNYRALALGGLVVAGPPAPRWLKKGMAGVWSQLEEQVLPDGGHFERSPMYHATALGDFLELFDLCRTCGVSIPNSIEPRVRSMLSADRVLCRPNGDLHLFNDSANGIAPRRAQLDQLGHAALGATADSTSGELTLPDSGFWGYNDSKSGERILVNCGDISPSYQPGHSHCDLLSFELDLAGRRVVVDSGISGYDDDPLRDYQRSTRAHNTVEIAGKEQSEIWATFRVARRARVFRAAAAVTNGTWKFAGSYRPYHDTSASHQRTIERLSAGAWRVTDRVDGAANAKLVSRIHFHPDFVLEHDAGSVLASAGSLRVSILPFGADSSHICGVGSMEPHGWFSPEFGVAMPAAVLELTVSANKARAFGYDIVIAWR